MTEPNTDTNNQVPLKIELLTCSASDYAKNQERELHLYQMIGIDSAGNGYESLNKIRQKARAKGCEVVVDLRAIGPMGSSYDCHAGTGLVLKKRLP